MTVVRRWLTRVMLSLVLAGLVAGPAGACAYAAQGADGVGAAAGTAANATETVMSDCHGTAAMPDPYPTQPDKPDDGGCCSTMCGGMLTADVAPVMTEAVRPQAPPDISCGAMAGIALDPERPPPRSDA